MTTFEVNTIIHAPIQEVWNTLADIGSISVWNPGVTKSYTTNDVDGLGGTRHCDLKGNFHLKEEVVTFEPNKAITFRITDSNTPFKTADIRFTLSSKNGSTVVNVSPVYKMKYGLIGKAMDSLFIYSSYKKGMAALLSGLKKNVESAVATV